MACVLVGLGLMPPLGATAPAVSSARLRVAEATGKNAVDGSKHLEERRPQRILTKESFLNAFTVLQAIGGSTNAVVHLMAIVGRHPMLSGTINLDTVDEIGRKTPLIIDLKPSGDNYMTDFHNSGGMVALLHEIKSLLYLDAKTVTGFTLGQEMAKTYVSEVPRHLSVIRSFGAPLHPASSLVVLRGNIAPGGAILKASATYDKRLLKHTGKAVCFAGSSDLAARIDDPELDVQADSVLVLQNIGPVGNPGMPEAGMIPIPRKLAVKGIKDMLRISDGRMSGTAGGTIILHVSPEAADPISTFGVVQTGDLITLDVENRRIHVEVLPEELQRRKSLRQAEILGEHSTAPWATRLKVRGYRGLYMREVNQAEHGADFDFLKAVGPS